MRELRHLRLIAVTGLVIASFAAVGCEDPKKTPSQRPLRVRAHPARAAVAVVVVVMAAVEARVVVVAVVAVLLLPNWMLQ
jgi:hypothetical protein